VPEIGPNDVLIKVKKTAICGTDVHIYNWDQLGAEDCAGCRWSPAMSFVGTVADFGAGGDGVQSRPAACRAEGHIVCGHCRNCRAGRGASVPQTRSASASIGPGAFGEYLAITTAQCRIDPR